MRFNFTVRELLLVFSIVAIGIAWRSDHRRLDSLITAGDPTAPVELRVQQASRLNGEQLERLRWQLMSQLPLHFDLAGLNAIELLGRFGAKNCLQDLRRIGDEINEDSVASVPGRFGPKIDWSISMIVHRLAANGDYESAVR